MARTQGRQRTQPQEGRCAHPLGMLVLVTGVSGSGKSTLINETLYPILNQHFFRAVQKPLPYSSIKGLKHLDKVIEIDQSPIGRTPRSNPATYTGVLSEIRNLFAQLPEAKIRGYKPGRFSFNVKGGRCETCEGAGLKTIEMNFLPDVYVHCEACNGKRFNRETLEVRYKGKSIADVLAMSVDEAVDFFEHLPRVIEDPHAFQRGAGIHHFGSTKHHPIRWRSTARQAGHGTEQERHRKHPVHSGRTHHRIAL